MDFLEGRLDWAAYSTFQFFAKGAPELTGIMRVGDLLGSYFAVGVILVIAVMLAPRPWRWRTALALVSGFLLGAMLVEGTKVATDRPRPPDAQNTLGIEGMSPSFPSRPVFLSAFALNLLAYSLERRTHHRGLRVAIYTGATLAIIFVCLSELWLGLSFVTDVLAGLAGGTARPDGAVAGEGARHEDQHELPLNTDKAPPHEKRRHLDLARFRLQPAQDSFRRKTRDRFKPPAFALISAHFARGDVEPPAGQM